MASETYVSGGSAYKITVNPAPADGKKHPVILLVHGNFGLGPPYGEQIQSFARDLAGLGYLTAVPQCYVDDESHPKDTVPKDRTLADAIAAVAGRADADADQLGLIGFSLGATTAMTFVATNPPGTVKVLADFFGFLTPAIRGCPGFRPRSSSTINTTRSCRSKIPRNSIGCCRRPPITTSYRLTTKRQRSGTMHSNREGPPMSTPARKSHDGSPPTFVRSANRRSP